MTEKIAQTVTIEDVTYELYETAKVRVVDADTGNQFGPLTIYPSMERAQAAYDELVAKVAKYAPGIGSGT